MITPTQMYWLVKLDDLRHVLKCITWLPIVLAVVIGVMAFATFMMTCGEKIANSEQVQTVGNKLYDLAVEWMDELKPRKGERTTP